MNLSEKIKQEIKKIDKYLDYDYSNINPLEEEANNISKSSSGSWLGYQSRVYYENFNIPPRGAHFSMEWGIYSEYQKLGIGLGIGSVGEWVEYDSDDVISYIEKKAGNIDISKIRKDSFIAKDLIEEVKDNILLLLHAKNLGDDSFFNKLLKKLEDIKILTIDDFIKYYMPKGKLSTRDMRVEKRLLPPPHIKVICTVKEITSTFSLVEQLSKTALKICTYIDNKESNMIDNIKNIGSHIFIGHGRSDHWRDLKDFIQDRLKLEWDEFNRIPVAGLSNTNRLSQMLNQSCFAFLIMSAEDEQLDGEYQARMNVIHEVGLFQGRLGFEKAIVLIEEGCKEFSNIQGLGQIRYPKGNISAKFEDIRRVLEREKIL